MCERERETERQREREAEREIERKTQRERGRDREREKGRDEQRKRQVYQNRLADNAFISHFYSMKEFFSHFQRN